MSIISGFFALVLISISSFGEMYAKGRGRPEIFRIYIFQIGVGAIEFVLFNAA